MKPVLIILLTVVCFLLFNMRASAQVEAAFIADSESGCNPLTIQFLNQSSGLGLSYFWDLGNGNTSTFENPQASYLAEGSYTITLIVSNGIDADTLVRTNYITVYNPPTVDFSVTDAEGCSPLSTQLIPETGTYGSSIVNYVWDIGNGQILTTESPELDISQSGLYSVLLTVYDSHGCFSAAYQEDIIEVFPNPLVSIAADETVYCAEPASVDFTGTVSGVDNYTVAWDFGDGTTSQEENPTHIYQSDGAYSVSFSAVSNHGCTDETSTENMITVAPLQADIQMPGSLLCPGVSYDFVNLAQGFASVNWTFSDGYSTQDTNVNRSFSNSGMYSVTLTAIAFNGCTQEVSYDFEVENIHAAFSVNTEYVCQLPAEVIYNDNSVNAVSWEWRLGNGEIFTEQNPTTQITSNMMSYEDPYHGNFVDTLIVTSANGCTDVAIVNNPVDITLPHAFFTPNNSAQYFSQMRGCVPLGVQFQAQNSYDANNDYIMYMQWDFGDGYTEKSTVGGLYTVI